MSITIDGRLLDLPDQDLNKNSLVEFNSIKLGGVTLKFFIHEYPDIT